MRLAIFYNYDIYSLKALSALVPLIAEHELALFFSHRVGGIEMRDPRLDELAQAETTFTNASGQDFDALAASAGADVIGVTAINSKDRCHLERFKPDLVISIRFGQIFNSTTIEIPRLGIINLHSGILPQYRGVMASFWSLLNGECELGTTLHWVTDSKIDSGHLISICKQPVLQSADYMSQVLSLYDAGVDQIVKAIEDIEKLAVQEKPDLPSGSYYSFPTKTDLDNFEAQGWRLL